MLCGRGRWPGASCPCREARTGPRPRAARRISSDSSASRPQSTGKRTGVQSYPSSSSDWGNPACRSRRARFERPRDAISPRIHVSMNAICAVVASSRLSARTCRAGGRPRASSMIVSIRRPVEARRTRSRFRRTILHLRILLDGLPRHTQAPRYLAPRRPFRVKEPGILPYRHRFRRSFPSRKPLEPAIRENTEVRAGPVPSSHRSDGTD